MAPNATFTVREAKEIIKLYTNDQLYNQWEHLKDEVQTNTNTSLSKEGYFDEDAQVDNECMLDLYEEEMIARNISF
jgi:hypothetical protein